MDILMYYILIGVCFMFCVESFQRSKIYKKATKKLGIPKNKIQLNNLSRIAGVLIWPAGLVVFFISFFKEVNRKK